MPSAIHRCLTLGVTLGATTIAGCGAVPLLDGERADVRFCTVAEGSQSTNLAPIRVAYQEAFDADVGWFAEQPGTSPLCLILAVGDPTSNPIGELPIRAENPNSPDAATITADNIATASVQFAQILASTQDLVGTPLLEALYALAVRGGLQPGDTVAVYSDMRQFSPHVRVPDLVRLGNAAGQADAIRRALDRLATAGLLPDGQAGRPSFEGIRLVVPAPSASARVATPDDPRLEAARQAAAEQLWRAWAERVGADLVWGGRVSA